MANELNTPNHRYYQNLYNVKLAPNEMSKQWILASGIARIDNAAVLPLFALEEPGTWYDPSDLTTLFQDNAGTTPVTAVGQTVGLMLDKSQGLALGPELVTNGDFSSGTGWTVGTGWSISGGTLNWAGAYNVCYFTAVPNAFVAGKYYKVTLTVSGNTSGNVNVYLNVPNNPLLNPVNFSGNGEKTFFLLAGITCNGFHIVGNSATGAMSIDNISVKLLAGNHATQVTSTQRPTYGVNPIVGTRNLLTYTDSPTASTGASVTTNVSTAPDGTNNAARVTKTDATTPRYVFQSWVINTVALANTVYTVSRYVKYDGYNTTVSVEYNSGTNFDKTWVATFNVTASGVTANTPSLCTSSVQNVGNGWYRIAATFTSGADPTASEVVVLSQITGALGTSVLMYGAQLELGSTATAYQKVVSQYEVTEDGVQSVSYLAFDGVDDGMVIPTITPGIDKVQVFAGVRKLSDAARAMLVELGPPAATGTFRMEAPSAASPNYFLLSTGTSSAGAGPVVTYTAPITNVLTGLGDISGDTVTLRINATQVATSSTDQGTGNYSTAVIYIGRRGGTTLPFNGRIYSLITRFGANLTDSQITSTESWVNAKTGAY